ncbi:MmcQ/YjbR family DNA-binding protein [Aeromicrobium sp.]
MHSDLRSSHGHDRDVRQLTSTFPRAYEAVVRDRIKFRVGSIVFVSFSCDEKRMGFAFPKEERENLVASRPTTFELPAPSEMHYNWAVARLDAIDLDEMREVVLDAWQMVVPKRLVRTFLRGE